MRKKIIIVMLLLLIISTLGTISSATSETTDNVSYQGKVFPQFPDVFNDRAYKLIYYVPSAGRYRLFAFDNNILNGDSCYYIADSADGPCLHIPKGFSAYDYIPEKSDTWVKQYNLSSGALNISGFSGDNVKAEIVYSNFDICYKDSTEVFFYRTPLLNFTTMQRAIGGNFWQTLTRAMKIMIPVGLTAFGAFCLIYLMRSKKWLPVKRKL